MVICMERGANDLHMVQLMPLPLRRLLLQQNPEWFILLVPAYPGCPRKRPLNVCVCVCVFTWMEVVDTDVCTSRCVIHYSQPPACLPGHLFTFLTCNLWLESALSSPSGTTIQFSCIPDAPDSVSWCYITGTKGTGRVPAPGQKK